ncbi:MAG: ABC transporter substrate-binding protein [Campylobacterales bacterium]|nr:ABC transporter substrate-binding protein [Campylobacterales bacterium]
MQLLWLHQFQFAGYYMAKEKGYYRESGLDVEIKPYRPGIDIASDVMNKRSTYGVGGSSLIIERGKGKKITFLMSTLQSSPLIFLTTQKSNIRTVSDLKGKRIMTVPGADVAVALYAMMHREGVATDDLIYLKDSFDVNDLINNKTDIMMGYESNEPFSLKEQGVSYTIFDPKKYGFDFYNDILYTSSDEAEKYPLRTAQFRDASLKGWKYALDHIDETVNLILHKYNTQHKSRQALLYEANTLKRLAYTDHIELGKLDKQKLQRIYDIYNFEGLIKKSFDVKQMVFEKSADLALSQEEKAYLQQKKEFTICVQPDLFPIDGIKEGVHTGITADVYALIAKKLGISFIPIASENKRELFRNIHKKRCDLVSIISNKHKMLSGLTSTDPFFTTHLALISRVNTPFISDITTLNGKKIVVRHSEIKNYLLQFDPRLTVDAVDSFDTIVQKILKDEAFCMAVPYESAEWLIQKYGIGKLKVNGFVGIEKPMEGSIGIVGKDDILLSILNKTLHTIPKETVHQIQESWGLKNYVKVVDYTPIWWVVFLSLTIFGIFIYRQRVLYRLNVKLEEEVEKRTYELVKSKKLLETIFNSTKESIAIIDKNAIFLFANKAYFGMSGYSESEIYQKSCLELTVAEDRAITESTLKIVEEIGYCNNIEIRCIQKDGTIIEVRMSVVALSDLDNFLIFATDITEENRLKKEHKEQEDQMIQQSRLAQMGEMISMIAHQWRQPLGAITATVLNIKLTFEFENFNLETQHGQHECHVFLKEKFNNIEDYVKNLTTTIDDFRNFYKPNKKRVMSSLKDVVAKALKIIRVSIETANIEIVEVYGDEMQFEIYENEMMQVLLNILKNAQDNFKENKRINAQITIKTKENTIIICDNGGGISEEIMRKIFDPYFSTKNEKNGTGLGLYMSKVIIEEHHKGTLSAQNTDDGVCFTMTLG